MWQYVASYRIHAVQAKNVGAKRVNWISNGTEWVWDLIASSQYESIISKAHMCTVKNSNAFIFNILSPHISDTRNVSIAQKKKKKTIWICWNGILRNYSMANALRDCIQYQCNYFITSNIAATHKPFCWCSFGCSFWRYWTIHIRSLISKNGKKSIAFNIQQHPGI